MKPTLNMSYLKKKITHLVSVLSRDIQDCVVDIVLMTQIVFVMWKKSTYNLKLLFWFHIEYFQDFNIR